MRKIAKATYQTPAEIERQIEQKQSMADALPTGNAKQALLVEIARLRVYGDLKRWTNEPQTPRLRPERQPTQSR